MSKFADGIINAILYVAFGAPLAVVAALVALSLTSCISVRPTATSHIKSTIVRTDTVTTVGDVEVVGNYNFKQK